MSAISVAARGHAAWITIDRPEVGNALDRRTLAELAAAVRAADAAAPRCLVLRGAGETFSSGGDITEMRAFDLVGGRDFIATLADAVAAIRGAACPIIARVDGYCLGGGLELVIACDLAIASDRAVFGQTGARVGGVPLASTCGLLAAAIGEKRAREMIFLAQRTSAADALRMGLVNKVVPAAELDQAVADWADRVAELSPQALRVAKRALALEGPADAPERIALVASVYDTDELREGTGAFLEKRRPSWVKPST
jgi:2-ketocyclohexanecarboxyl-CoA hydrolase